MTALALVGTAASLVLLLFLLLLWVRFLLDLVQVLSAGWRPTGVLLVLAEVVFTVTDPPVKAARRVLPPVRIGGASLDVGATAVMLAVVVLLWLTARLELA